MRVIPFASVLIGVFLDNLLFNVLIPVLPFYAETLHLTHRELGWLISSYTLALLCTVFISGVLTDKFGPSKNFLLGSALLVQAVFLLKISDSYPLMITARVLQGISAGFTWVAGFSYVAKNSAPEKAARNLIILQSGMGVAEFVGPVIGGFLYEKGGASLLFNSLLLISAFNLLLRLAIWEDTPHSAEQSARIDLSPLADPRIRRLAIIYLCGGFLLSVSDPMLPVFLKHQYALSEGRVSLAFFAITATYYTFALPITALTRNPVMIYIGISMSAVALALIFIPYQSVFFTFGALGLFGFGTGLFILPVVARIADAMSEANSDAYGVAFSSSQWSYTLGMFIGPIMSTQLAEYLPYSQVALVAAAVPMLLLVLIRRI